MILEISLQFHTQYWPHFVQTTVTWLAVQLSRLTVIGYLRGCHYQWRPAFNSSCSIFYAYMIGSELSRYYIYLFSCLWAGIHIWLVREVDALQMGLTQCWVCVQCFAIVDTSELAVSYPSYSPMLIRAQELWFHEPAVTTPVLKLFAELAQNRLDMDMAVVIVHLKPMYILCYFLSVNCFTEHCTCMSHSWRHEGHLANVVPMPLHRESHFVDGHIRALKWGIHDDRESHFVDSHIRALKWGIHDVKDIFLIAALKFSSKQFCLR